LDRYFDIIRRTIEAFAEESREVYGGCRIGFEEARR
jgi:hypothetical protein